MQSQPSTVNKTKEQGPAAHLSGASLFEELETVREAK